MAMNDYVARALAGCAFLDDHFGDRSWRDRLDIDSLDISDRLNCVIGQLFIDPEGLASPYLILPAYIAAQEELGIDGDSPRNAALGFDLTEDELDSKDGYLSEYELLTIAWNHALSV